MKFRRKQRLTETHFRDDTRSAEGPHDPYFAGKLADRGATASALRYERVPSEGSQIDQLQHGNALVRSARVAVEIGAPFLARRALVHHVNIRPTRFGRDDDCFHQLLADEFLNALLDTDSNQLAAGVDGFAFAGHVNVVDEFQHLRATESAA